MELSRAMEAVAAFCLAAALLQTFLVKQIQHGSLKFKKGSVGREFFHLLGEIEVVFGFWSGIFLAFLWAFHGGAAVSHYLESLSFTEPVFVFAIMIICSTKPILAMAESILRIFSRLIPLGPSMAFFLTVMVLGPLLGSLITEPAAMTVIALILARVYFSRTSNLAFKYAVLGLLFVNVSIGGTLTPFAAPPILMVAAKWNWDLSFMMGAFGWKGALACLLSTAGVAFRFRKELAQIKTSARGEKAEKIPFGVSLLHLVFLVLIVATSHQMVVFMGLFFFFLGLVNVTRKYQNELLLRNGLLVAFFLGGLVILGFPQAWWLGKILTGLNSAWLYLGSMALTAFTDNAALTYLGAQVPDLSEASRYFLVAGSVVGGGLTVVANAPNPVGFGILGRFFGREGISPLRLFLHALGPTLIAAFCFWFF